MKMNIQTDFILTRMINATIEHYAFLAKNPQVKEISNWKRNLSFLSLLLFNTILFAQAPTVNYSGVQSNYTVNLPLPSLTPSITGGQQQVRTEVSTIAGNGASGYADGTTASPKYYSPTGIAIATSGNMYIADSQNHCIRKITASGLVSTLAGAGLAGFANGSPNQALFNTPYAVAVDAAENVYVIESTSNAIRKITTAGVVSTFAGNVSTAGYLDGPGATALFSSPKGLDVDTAGNVYVADADNNRIRKISSTGVVSTFAGSGVSGYFDAQGISAKFNNPTSVAVTNSGALYVSDTSNNRIRSIATSGMVTTFAGSGASGTVNGQGTSAQFNAPRALTVDASGTVYVVDYSNNRIRKITNAGLVSTLAGTGAFGAANGPGTSATFRYPAGIAVNAAGEVFLADVTNNCIRKITTSGVTSTFSGSAVRGLENGQGGTMAMLNGPVAVAVTATGIIYVIDDFNSCIRKITANGIVTTFAGNSDPGYADGAGSSALFNSPKGIAVDASGAIYVADTFNNRIRKITSSGVVTTIAGDGTTGYLDGQGTSAKFNNPYALTVDSVGNIYVADTKNHRIRKISTSGVVTTVAGYILSGFADGASNVARFKNPQGITIDNSTGILYVVDATNNRIRKIATDGSVSTFAGSYQGYADDLGIAANFNNPIGIAIDSAKNLYVGDYYNSVIRKVDPTGLVSTYAGNGVSEFLDGIGNVASFYFPVGVAADTSGNVYAADSYTQRIRKISSVEPFTILPALPAGLNFNTATGVLSGTPTELKSATTYTITASNYSGTGTTTITFAIGTASGISAPTANAQSFCNGATVSNLVANGTALKWYTSATGGTVLSSNTVLTTRNYYVSQTVNSVESSRTAVAVTVNTTVAPSASAQTFSNSATVANLVANGSSLQWYTASNGGSALATSTALSTGNYYVSQTLNGCESSRTLVLVTINTAPGAPTANAQSFCSGATVSDLVATGTALKWYTSATGGTVLSSNTVLTTRNYYVSQTVNSVESTRTAVSVTVNTTALPSATSQTFCSGAIVANLVAGGSEINWYTVGSGGSPLESTTALIAGILYVSQTINGCESSRMIIGININTTAPPTASSQSFTNSATVANLVANGTSLKWYDVASGGLSLASNNSLASGNYYVSQTLNGCESTRTLVLVTINSVTPAPTAFPQSFCNSATVSNLVASGTSIKWYTSSNGGIALVSSTSLSTGNYYVSQTVNSIESSRAIVAVTVTVTEAPQAAAQFFCNTARVSNLTANGTSLRWYTNLNGGTALIAATGLVTGNFYVSQTINGCESSRTQVPVTVSSTAVPIVTSQSFCSGSTVADLTANGTALKWYTTLTGGIQLVSSTVLSSGTYFVSQTLNTCESARVAVSVTVNSVLTPTASSQTFTNSASVANLVANGTNLQWYTTFTGGTALPSTTALSTGTYYVSQRINGCESSRASVSVVINLETTSPIALSQTFCSGAKVLDLVATGSSLRWYILPSGGTVLNSDTLLVTGNYYVSQTVNFVESPRTLVSVTINATNAPFATAQIVNSGATVASLSASGTSLKWYANSIGGVPLSSNTLLLSGNYYVSQTINGCESSRTIVQVTVNTSSGAPSAAAQSLCNGATVGNLLATGTALKWYLAATGGTALAPTTVLITRIYYVSQTVNSVESSRTAVAVTVSTTPLPNVTSQTFCSGAKVANLVGNGTSIKWYTSNTSAISLAAATILTSGIYYASQTLNGCESPRIIIGVTINTTAAPTASAQTFDYNAKVSDLVASGNYLQWYTSATGGNALVGSSSLQSGTYYVSQTVNGCESTRRAVNVTLSIAIGAPTAFAQSFCNASTVADLQANGSSLKWYSVAVGGTVLPISKVLTSGNYYVSQTVNNIESARTLVSISVYGTPTSQTISSPTYSGSSRSTICTSDYKVINVKSGYVSSTIEWEVAVMPLRSAIKPLASEYTKIEGATGASYTVTNATPGRNYFRAKFINGDCEATAKYSNEFVVFYSGCGSSARLSAVSYPNPFTDNFKLSISSSSGENVKVFIYDLTGRLVEEREINLEDLSEIELGDKYPSGVFIVNVTQEDTIKTLKVVKR